MQKEEALTRLEEILNRNRSSEEADVFDPEVAHGKADEVLCDLLVTLGHTDVVKVYESIQPKWCA